MQKNWRPTTAGMAAWTAAVVLTWGGATGVARASGDPGPTDEFVTRWGPGNTLAGYEAGQLGVVLPSFERVYLYTAWRAIVLGAEGYRKAPTMPGGLERARGAYVDGWVNLTDENHPYTRWMKASEAAAPRRGAVPRTDAITLGPDYGSYINCPAAAFSFATETLQTVGHRADATPQRLAGWVAGQDAVFAFCDYDPKPREGAARKPAPALPAPLPASEPAYWRQLRDYQIAAAHFYSANLTEAAKRFGAIGKTPDHPMRPWGAYLALRAHLRQATLADTPIGSAEQEAAAAPLLAEAQQILGDASLAQVHEATRATVRTLQFRLTPRRRFAELSAALEDVHANPYAEDHLGDWRRVANLLIEEAAGADRATLEASLRQRHDYFDWIRTMQLCGVASNEAERVARCRKEAPRVLAKWQRWGLDKSIDGAGHRQAWLLAALSLTDRLEPALEKAALEVRPDAPEYFSVRYQLTRLYRLSARPERARELAQAALAEIRQQNLASLSAINLFTQERFAQATSLKDASDHLMRRTGSWRVPDTGEAGSSHAAAASEGRPASDGLTWLNTRLAVGDLLALARDERLGLALRKRVAVAAWMRADLLGEQEPAKAASLLVETLAPGLRSVAQQYRAIPQPRERQHALLIAAMSWDLSPLFTTQDLSNDAWAAPTPAPDKGALTASMWCSVAKNQRDVWQQPLETREVEQAPPPPEVSGDSAARDGEMAALAQLKTATGFVGDHVLAWAKDHPTDPEVPWLLYVVVQSTRGGCLDADASKTSKAAFQLLHQRYKDSEWTSRTRVWY